MKTIPEILNLSQERYDHIVFGNYMLWCDLNTSSDQEVQSLLANTTVFNWWLFEYRLLEDEFKQRAAPYLGKSDVKALFQLYVETAIKIRDFFPQSLIRQARKQKVICTHN